MKNPTIAEITMHVFSVDSDDPLSIQSYIEVDHGYRLGVDVIEALIKHRINGEPDERFRHQRR